MSEYEASLARKTEEVENNPYSIDKLSLVALGGAIGSLVLYYIYNNLDDEFKTEIKNYLYKSITALLPKTTQVETEYADRVNEFSQQESDENVNTDIETE